MLCEKRTNNSNLGNLFLSLVNLIKEITKLKNLCGKVVSKIKEKNFFEGKLYMEVYRVSAVNLVLIWENYAHGM